MMIKKTALLLTAAISVLAMPARSFACTAIYAGANTTMQGETIIGRSETVRAGCSWPKLYGVSPSGNHKAGEEYTGCYGFTWNFTHDSYAYTAFCDDNSQAECPDCGGTHAHTPYQAAGTNEKGLTVTATVTMKANEKVLECDPYVENGIEEAEMATILLSECATAEEAVKLLADIYSQSGAADGSGVLMADADQAWYIENMSGTQFIAVRLNPDILFISPNISVLGRIDLDDTENVFASDRVIDVAVEAGTFAGDEEENVIEFGQSYEKDFSEIVSEVRIPAGLNYLNAANHYETPLKEGDLTREEYSLTNVDQDGNIVKLRSNLKADRLLDIQEVFGFYRTEHISFFYNFEVHIFQISDSSKTGTVEWTCMSDAQSNVFVPCYPMLINDVYAPYKKGCEHAELVEEEPEEGVYFLTEEKGWEIFPEGWQDSFFWVSRALTYLREYEESSAPRILEETGLLQEEIGKDWTALQERVAGAADEDEKIKAATQGSIEIAQKAFARAKDLLEELGVTQ